jgi:hypothetical protein
MITLEALAEKINQNNQVTAEVLGEELHLTQQSGRYGGSVVLVGGRVEKSGFGRCTRPWAVATAERAFEALCQDLLMTLHVVSYEPSERATKLEIETIARFPLEDELQNIVKNCKRFSITATLYDADGFACGRVSPTGHYSHR